MVTPIRRKFRAMKAWWKPLLFLAAVVVLALGWILYFHNAPVAENIPNWGWLQSSVKYLGQKPSTDAPEDEDPDNTKNDIPVHTAHISTATLHRYVEGFGIVAARPAKPGGMAGAANIASPVPGLVSHVLCELGQKVNVGDAVIQLDDRLAKSAEDQAAASLAQAEASLAGLKATPRPDQLQIAELTVKKSESAFQFAKKNYDRLSRLMEEQGTSAKSVEQASVDMAAAQTDLAISQKQLVLLKNSPTPEELRAEQSKVAQAAAALATAQVQRKMLTIFSPIDATVTLVSVNPGECVDVTRAIVQLIALDRLAVNLDVPADQLPANAVGLAAQILLPSSPAGTDPIVGKISSVNPQVDPRNGSVGVAIELPAGTTLRPGLCVRVRIVAEEHKDILAVPRDAVVPDENGDSVISVVEGTQATHKAVKAGLEENGLVEITADGLKEGGTVVTAGAFGLPAASRVKVLD